MGITIIIILLLVTISVVYYIVRETNNKIDSYMSFRESMDLTELPVVTFYQGEKKINFLLDTGSNKSLINSSVIKDLSYVPIKSDSTMFGVEGNYTKVEVAVISLFYNNIEYANDFMIADLDKPFSNIKQESGVTIHGILGNNFFKRNKSILDFEELKAYFKK